MKKTYKLHHFFAAIFLLLSLGILIFSTWCGIGLTYDSYDYLAAATAFRNNGILLNAHGSAFLIHAPFFPVFISALGNNPLIILKLFNILFFGVTLIIIYLTNCRLFKNNWFCSISVLIIGLSVGHQMIYNFLWSEPLFLFFFALHNFFLVRFLGTQRNYDFWLLILFAFMMCLTRNAGFFIIIPTSWILFTSHHKSWRSMFQYFFISTLGFGLWNVYVIAAHNGMGSVYFSNEFFVGIWINASNYLKVMSLWFLPAFVPFIFRLLVMIPFVAYLGFLFYKIEMPKPAAYSIVQSTIYILIMIFIGKFDDSEIERLLSIIYPWLIVALLLVLDQLWKKFDYLIKRIIIFFMILWMSYLGTRSIHNAIMWHSNQCAVKINLNTD